MPAFVCPSCGRVVSGDACPVCPPPAAGRPMPPPLPAAERPGVIVPYRAWCVCFVAIYIAIAVWEILKYRGVVAAELGPIEDALTRGEPDIRRQLLAGHREDAFGGAVVAVFGAMFYGFAAFVPRRPWGWVVGLVAIIGSLFPFCITAAGMIPLVIAWVKPGTKRGFDMRA